MTASWGPGYDAEIAYRHEQVRTHYRRSSGVRWPFRRRSTPTAAPAGPATESTAATSTPTAAISIPTTARTAPATAPAARRAA